MGLFSRPKRSLSSEDHATEDGYVLLNDDDVPLTPTLRQWVLSCAFDDKSLILFADKLLNSCSPRTVRELNWALDDLAAKPIERKVSFGQAATHSRFCKAVKAYLERVERNASAYSGQEAGFWPDPTGEPPRSLFTELPYVQTHKFIDRSTPISSAGSCFAVEIAHRLQADGFNYVVAEENRAGNTAVGSQAPVDSSAAWGIIFNTPSFRQLIERSFGLRPLPKILWSGQVRKGSKEVYMDPFREHIEFESPEEYVADYATHLEAARKAVLAAKVFIITLGLNEVWTFKMDGSVFSRSPWRIAPSFVDHKVLTVDENVDELQTLLNAYRRFNPDVKLIVTLSPIPLHATFLSRTAHVVEANTHSKAVLRVAAQQFVEANQGVYYFPSYELIMSGIENPWLEDQRHVKESAVERAMEMFRAMYVLDERPGA